MGKDNTMAIAEPTNKKLVLNVPTKLNAEVALDATLGMKIILSEDRRTIVLLRNADTENAEEVTIKAGTGLQGVADKVVSLEASEEYMLQLESGAFGNAGAVYLTGTADVKARIAELAV
jgi:hypothetical protein